MERIDIIEQFQNVVHKLFEETFGEEMTQLEYDLFMDFMEEVHNGHAKIELTDFDEKMIKALNFNDKES